MCVCVCVCVCGGEIKQLLASAGVQKEYLPPYISPFIYAIDWHEANHKEPRGGRQGDNC